MICCGFQLRFKLSFNIVFKLDSLDTKFKPWQFYKSHKLACQLVEELKSIG